MSLGALRLAWRALWPGSVGFGPQGPLASWNEVGMPPLAPSGPGRVCVVLWALRGSRPWCFRLGDLKPRPASLAVSAPFRLSGSLALPIPCRPLTWSLFLAHL